MIERIHNLLKNKQLDDNVKKGLEELLKEEIPDKNIEKKLEKLLAKAVVKERRFKKLLARSDKEDRKIRELHKELNEYKNKLEIKVKKEIEKRQQHEKILHQQSKFAAMGEMIDAVAHQWKQPINIIYTDTDMLDFALEMGEVDKEYIKNFKQKTLFQINHMVNTLDEFRTFFKPNKCETKFSVKKMIEKVLLLIKDELVGNQIKVNLNTRQDFTIIGIENEFKHLILNLINNAKDAFIVNQIEKRAINIDIDIRKNSYIIEIIDNAGGIPTDLIDNIFHVNISTKPEKEGGGIGLYMSSQIAKKHNGTLSAKNIKDGVKFVFSKKIEF